MTRKRFQHSSEYFGRGLKIVMRLPIVADSCFFSNPEEQNLKGGGEGLKELAHSIIERKIDL